MGEAEEDEETRAETRLAEVIADAAPAEAAAMARAALAAAPGRRGARRLFWAAHRAGAGALAHFAAEAFSGMTEGDETLLALLEKFRAKRVAQLGLLQTLPARGPRIGPHEPGRLVYAIQSSLPDSVTGYAARGHGLARALIGAGLDVVALTRPGFPEFGGEDAEIDGVRYRRLPPEPGALSRQAALYEAEFMRLRPEWVLAASPWWNAAPALVAARALGLPFAYEVRGFWEITRLSEEPGFAEDPAFRLLSRLEAAVATAADHVFTLTAAMRAELLSRGVAPGRASLLPNACDPARLIRPERDAGLAARLGLPEGVPVIGYVGSFEPYEGLDDLVLACGRLRAAGRAFRLLLVGAENPAAPDPGALTRRLHALAAESGLGDWMIAAGKVPQAAIPAHYALIDVAPLPRKPSPVTEMVSPLKPFEAMALGTPLVVSSVGALAEIVRDGETGLVFAKGDGAALEAALARMLDDPPLRARLAAAARNWVSRERTWAKTAERAKAGLEGMEA